MSADRDRYDDRDELPEFRRKPVDPATVGELAELRKLVPVYRVTVAGLREIGHSEAADALETEQFALFGNPDCMAPTGVLRAPVANPLPWNPAVDTCPVHGCPEPCPTCSAYIAGGL